MPRSESEISARIALNARHFKARLLRNNRGLFYTLSGEKTRAGLEAPGSSDRIGWTQVEITPDMVGMTVAVFTACEVKRKWNPNKKLTKTEEDQVTFVNAVKEAGGIGFFCDDEDTLKQHLTFPPKRQ